MVNSVQAKSAALVMLAPSYFIVMIVALFKVRLLSDALSNKINGIIFIVKHQHKKQKSRQPNGECLILVGLIYRLMPR